MVAFRSARGRAFAANGNARSATEPLFPFDLRKESVADDQRRDADNAIVGGIWFYQTIDYFDALEIGYIVFDQSSRNKGYVTEALSLLVRFLFETRKVNRLQLSVVVGNAASKRIAEKCGFLAEGIARKAVFLRGKHADVEWFSLLREEAEQQPWGKRLPE